MSLNAAWLQEMAARIFTKLSATKSGVRRPLVVPIFKDVLLLGNGNSNEYFHCKARKNLGWGSHSLMYMNTSTEGCK